MIISRESVYRPSPGPTTDLPFGVRSVGHFHVAEQWQDTIKVKPFVQVFWGIDGTGTWHCEGRRHLLRAGEVAVYLPNMEHNVRAQTAPWRYRWFTLDGAYASIVTTSFGLVPAKPRAVGQVPEDVFIELETAVRDVGPDGERRAAAVAFRLLSLAAGAPVTATDSVAEDGRQIIAAEWADNSLDVAAVARRLGLHRSSFSRRFTATMGQSPAEYLRALRMQNALALLKQTDRSVSEISAACGYRDASYFSRDVRRVTSMSPTQFRDG